MDNHLKVPFLTLIIGNWLFGSSILAQTYNFHHYTTKEGLSSSTVYYSYQDRDGYLWIGTNSGVNRFDGHSFKQYTMEEGLSDNEVLNISQDSKGRIWFLTFNGRLSYYYEDSIYNEDNDPFLKKLFISKSFDTFFEDSNGKIYLGTIGNTFLIIDKDSVSEVLLDEQMEMVGFKFMELTPGEMRVFAGNKIYLLDKGKLKEIPAVYHCSNSHFFGVFKQYYYYLAYEGIVKAYTHSEEITIPASELPDYNSITGFFELGKETIVTTRYGIILYTPNRNGRYDQRWLMKGVSITFFLKDREGNSWFCSDDEGLFMLPAQYENFQVYAENAGLLTSMVYRVTADSSGTIWLGQNKACLSSIKNGKVRNYYLNDLIQNQGRILDLTITGNTVWMATDGGVVEFLPGKICRLSPTRLFTGELSCSASKTISSDGKDRITCTYFQGLVKYDKENQYFVPIGNKKDYTRTYTHTYDSKGRLWVATIDGLATVEGNKFTTLPISDSLQGTRILDITELKDDNLALATDGSGLLIFDGKNIVGHFTDHNGLISNVCRRVYFKNDSLWICTDRGLQVITLTGSKLNSMAVLNFSTGLPSDDIRDVCLRDGIIRVATSRGLCVLKSIPGNILLTPPPLHITSFYSNEKKIDPKGKVELSYRDNKVRISFIGLSFRDPSRIRYQYMINENSNWAETENTTVDFANLSPGKYTFKLRARSGFSDWSPVEKLEFVINPPFWMTIGFRLSIAMVLALTIYFLQRFLSQQRIKVEIARLREREVIQQERVRISEDMHDDLGSDLTKIAVLSEMIRVKEALKGETSGLLDKISFHAADLRKKFDEIIWALNPENDTVGDLFAYLHTHARDFFEGSGIKCSVQMEGMEDEKVASVYRRTVFLTFKEVLNNILRHAKASEVKIMLQNTTDFISIEVEDDGVGFDLDALAHEGHGLKNLRNRTERIGGNVEMISLPGKGTRTTLEIPLQS